MTMTDRIATGLLYLILSAIIAVYVWNLWTCGLSLRCWQ